MKLQKQEKSKKVSIRMIRQNERNRPGHTTVVAVK